MRKILYLWHIFVKVFMFFLFGFGSLILIFLIFPVIRVFTWDKLKFKRKGRKVMCFTQKIFVAIGTALGGFRLQVENRKVFKDLSSMIIVANHPSLLDVVMLLSLIPNADCIIKSSLGKKNILRGIVNALYIPNSLDFDQLVQACTKSLGEGNCLIIFPEGTRTKADGRINLKKGAARIALASGCQILPVYIGGTDKAGLRKHDPLLSYNRYNRYVYTVKTLPAVDPAAYKNQFAPVAARNMTAVIQRMLEYEYADDAIRIREKESILFDKGK
ncbi:MAG: 1-acyl-sn-glycerol-3-phosphate acyltransferase [Spirochaetia bacterium]|nr:1-acyl-sn-glycerol-3-phosphate acyltransferase [Spirochaetia bacterium]